MNFAKCRWCGGPIDKFSYENKLFCSNRCRTRYCRERITKKGLKPIEGVTGGVNVV